MATWLNGATVHAVGHKQSRYRVLQAGQQWKVLAAPVSAVSHSWSRTTPLKAKTITCLYLCAYYCLLAGCLSFFVVVRGIPIDKEGGCKWVLLLGVGIWKA